MDGYTATIKIREAGFNELPIVALSALTSTDEINRMFDVGMNGYLAKPFYKERLYTVFSMFIGVKEGEHKSRSSASKQVKEKKIPELKSLDIKQGLENAKNSELFYKEILDEFLDAFGESGKLMEKLLYDFRYEQARILAIDIRGLSGAIGANRLHELSKEILQLLLFKKYDILEAKVKEFQEEMEQLRDDISLYLDKAA
jgi:CheY-like chemotaxis protein